jgi:hypothetical protein
MSLNSAIKYITKYAKQNDKNVYELIDKEILDENNDDKYYYFENVIDNLNLSITLIKPPCCFFKDDNDDDDFSKVYLGVHLCCNDIVSRFNISSFDTFEEYKNFYTDGVKNAEQDLINNKTEYIENLKKMLPKTINKPKFYSLPNDCYSCT